MIDLNVVVCDLSTSPQGRLIPFHEFDHILMEVSILTRGIYLVAADPLAFRNLSRPPGLSNVALPFWEFFKHEALVQYSSYYSAARNNHRQRQKEFFCFSWITDREAIPKPAPPTGHTPVNWLFIALLETKGARPISSATIRSYLFFLITEEIVRKGGFCVHSAALARKNDGFLFLGRSGAGKSTVAALGSEIGFSALGDDLNFILKEESGGFSLLASPSPSSPGFKFSLTKPELTAIFQLVQDKNDYLLPMKPIQAAQLLFDGFLKQSPYIQQMPDERIAQSFRTACSLARRIPTYELHFRKSTGFWKIIQEEFPS